MLCSMHLPRKMFVRINAQRTEAVAMLRGYFQRKRMRCYSISFRLVMIKPTMFWAAIGDQGIKVFGTGMHTPWCHGRVILADWRFTRGNKAAIQFPDDTATFFPTSPTTIMTVPKHSSPSHASTINGTTSPQIRHFPRRAAVAVDGRHQRHRAVLALPLVPR